jgi:membrane-associated phospholipid phosphatase
LAAVLGAWPAAPALAAGPAPGVLAAGPAPRDSSVAAPVREGFVSRRDPVRLLFAASLIALVSRRDQAIANDAAGAHSTFAHDLARIGEHYGNPLYSAPVVAGLWALGRLEHKRGLSASALRIAGGVAATAVVTGGLKEVVGRWRPVESPADPYRYKAFSNHVSFPSAHTGVAFSLASGIDRETRARWVPWVVYPLAGVTAWSRIHDREHWASDVTTGAIVGLWATHKFDLVVRRRGARGGGAALRVGVAPAGDGRGVGPAVTLAF